MINQYKSGFYLFGCPYYDPLFWFQWPQEYHKILEFSAEKLVFSVECEAVLHQKVNKNILPCTEILTQSFSIEKRSMSNNRAKAFRHCLPLSQPAVWCSHRHSPFGLLVHLFGAQQLRQGEARPGCQTTDDHGTIVKWKASDLGLLARYICLLAASSRTSYVHQRSLG